MNKSILALAVAAAAAVGYASLPTPGSTQTAPARPDFNGIWGGGVAKLEPTTCNKVLDAFAQGSNERFAANGAKGGQKWIAFEQDCGIQHRGHISKPEYKPQYWEEVRLRDYYANAGGKWDEYADPQWKNYPLGVPRLGPPNKIVHTANEVIFLYENQNQFRAVPTDCREHDPVLKYDQTVNGLAVGCWEGDTLVVTSMGFTDKTWLDWPGYMHSAEMVVVEKFRRQGDQLLYDVTVNDPEMFIRPWQMDPVRLTLNKDPNVQLMQDVPYIDRSLGNIVDPNYRG